VSLHYVMDDIEIDYILDAVDFVAERGRLFLPLYRFDLHTGSWTHKADCVSLEPFSLEAALECTGYQSRSLGPGARRHLYAAFLAEARETADELAAELPPEEFQLDAELEELKFFSVPESSVANDQ
jgi:hypothetical protein